jgi:glycosyltransferase involved in cell wall biosynthesis
MNGGSATHLRHLLKVWAEDGIDREHEIVLFAREENIDQLRPSLTPNVRLRTVGGQGFGPVRKLLWEQLRFGRLLREEKVDVLFCTANLVPFFTRTPTVVALRNAGPFCESINLRAVGFRLWAYMKLTGVLMRLSVARATRVIFISRYFQGVFARLGFPAAKGDVIYHGRDAHDLAADVPALPSLREGRYMLFVGNLYRYKNVVELIEAYAAAREDFTRERIRLVIVGNPLDAPYHERLLETVKKHGLEQDVVFTGGVPHHEILASMGRCEAFIFQSTCENCPNTLIEALAEGLPIACSNAGVMPEIAGDAVEYFDPFDPRDIARALKAVVFDAPRAAALRGLAREQAKKFPTWQEVGRMTLATLRRAAGTV